MLCRVNTENTFLVKLKCKTKLETGYIYKTKKLSVCNLTAHKAKGPNVNISKSLRIKYSFGDYIYAL